jgi:hypothetical protein
MIEDAVEEWKRDHDGAVDAGDTEDLVAITLELHAHLRDWVREAWGALFAGEPINVQETGDSLAKWLGKAVAELLPDVKACIDADERRGHTIEASNAFATAAQELWQLHDDVQRRWPRIDPREVEVARAEIARGEFQTGEEILRELQGDRPH